MIGISSVRITSAAVVSNLFPMVLHMNVPIIAMSGNEHSLLAKYSNIHLKCKVNKEACPLNLAPTSSTTAALALGDALAIALMKVRDFKPRDFAQFHPALN